MTAIRLSRHALRVASSPGLEVTPEALPGTLPRFFPTNWRVKDVQLETAFSTDVVRTKSLSETRRGLLEKPVRSITALASGMTQDAAADLFVRQIRGADEGLPLPLWMDEMESSAASSTLSPTFTTIPVGEDARLRRFVPGAQIWVVQLGYCLSITDASIYTVQSVHHDRIVIQTQPSTIPAGSRLFPSMDVQVRLQGAALSVVTDYISEIKMGGKEIGGASALPAAPSSVPWGFPVYQGLPVFDTVLNWVGNPEVRIVREGRTTSFGRTGAVQEEGALPQAFFNVSMLETERADAFSVVRFFESRRGRLLPFWFPNPFTLFQIVAVNAADELDVAEGLEPAEIQAFFPYILVETAAGLQLRALSSAAGISGAIRLFLATPLSPVPSVSDILRVSTVHLVRFSGDSLTERWSSPELCSFQLKMQEVLEEAPATVPEISA